MARGVDLAGEPGGVAQEQSVVMQELLRCVKTEKPAEATDHREGFTAGIRSNEPTNLD